MKSRVEPIACVGPSIVPQSDTMGRACRLMDSRQADFLHRQMRRSPPICSLISPQKHSLRTPHNHSGVATMSVLNRRSTLKALMAGLLAAKSLPVHAAEEGFTSLFDGKDLTGWVKPASEDCSFSVEDGAIVGRTNGKLKKNEFLCTPKAYGDFVLKAKVKLRNGNSGIQFRSARADDGAVAGPQADVADGYWGLLYEERRRGILERYPKEEAEKLIKNGDWNDFRIEAKGKHVRIFINGTKVIDRKDEAFEAKGIIALQVHVGPAMEVSYKDIEIKETN